MPQVVQLLKKNGREDIIVVCGGVIPETDYDFLYKNGVNLIFGPGLNYLRFVFKFLGTRVTDAADKILDMLTKKK